MPELRRNFHAHLRFLEDDILGMGQRVLRMLARGMAALQSRRGDEADAVIAADDEVDALYRATQERVLALLALEAPVASELRLVSALMHTSIRLERVGDLCVNIARYARQSEQLADDADVRRVLEEMGTHAHRLLERSLQSLAHRDVALAQELPELDDPLDRLNAGLSPRLVQLAAGDVQRLDWAFHTVLVGRYLERIGDHAVAIGQQVVFYACGTANEPAATPRTVQR
ncbi:MAG: phosphate signaling complex protein PhoU [Egibacteraceae bacterium]